MDDWCGLQNGGAHHRQAMISRKQLSVNSLLLPLPSGRATPHFFLFLFFNLAYFLPLFGAMIFNYSEGGTGKAADLSSDVARKITAIYLLGIFAFWCGSK